MALDRQKILSELGSVMNQLQSADCGCMGKLFNGQGQGQPQGQPLPTCGGCRRGCCPGHGMGMGMGMRGGTGGNPHMGNMGMGGSGGGMGCMGHCNAPKLYADTYGYLNQNLMKPVMNEVYNDLKSISPANAVGNSPMAAQLGLSPGAGGPIGSQSPNPMAQNIGNMGNMLDGGGLSGPNPDAMVHGLPATKMGGQPMMDGGSPMMGGGQPMMVGGQPMMGGGQSMMGGGKPMMGGGQPMMDGGQTAMGESGNDMGMRNGMGPASGNPMSGMGAQIMNMMSSGGGKHRSPNMQGGQMTNPMGTNQGQLGVSQMGMAYAGQSQGGHDGSGQISNPGGMAQGFADPQTQFVSGNQVFNADINANPMAPASGGQQPMQGAGQQMGQPIGQTMAQQMGQRMEQPMGGNPGGQPITNQTMGSGGPRITGNVTMPMGGPQAGNAAEGQYGQHNAGMKKFAEMFPGVLGGDLGFDPMAIALQMNPANQKRVATDTMMKLMGVNQGQTQPALTGANAANAQLGQQSPAQQQVPGQQAVYQQQIPVQQAITGQPVYQQGDQIQPRPSMVAQPGQPMFDGQATPSHQTLAPSGQAVQPIYRQNQQVYSATGAPSMTQQQITEGQEGYQDPNSQVDSNAEQAASAEGEAQPQPQQMIYRDPIFPAERKIPKSLPSSHKYAAYYNTLGQPVQMVPQSIYKKPEEPGMPVSLSWPEPVQNNRTGIKNVMSKTSITGNMALPNSPSRSQLQHYYRQLKGAQGHKPPVMPPNQLSSSDGKLNHNMPKQELGIPVEKVGGDTIANNLRNQIMREETGKAAGGDIKLPSKPHGDVQKEPLQTMPAMGGRVRNGLQDTNYGSKYMSNAWSFHGTCDSPARPSRNTGTFTTPLIGRNHSHSHRTYY